MNEQHAPLDWRYRVATTLAEDFLSPWTGVLHRKGSPVSVRTYVQHDKRRINIGDPSAPALFLSQSYKAFEQALKIHPFLGDSLPAGRKDPSPVVYDYLELIMASVVFAYTSVEAFANEEIPEDLTYETQRPSGLIVPRPKESIEQRVSLDEKLATVLPQALGKPSPKRSKVWEDYVNLRRLRHRIVHLKSSDRAHSQHNDLYPDSIWSELLRPKQPNYPSIAKNVILHFRDRDDTHWLKYCPF